jgi:hypothetical protein
MMSRTLPLLLALIAGTALAQREPPDAPKVAAGDGGPPRVYFAHSYNLEDQGWYTAGLGDRLSVHVQNFEKILEKTAGACGGIVLFIDGIPIRGLKPESCDQQGGHVRYYLRRTEQSNDTWSVLLGKPHHHEKSVSISIGTNEQFSIESTVTEFQLLVIPSAPFWGFMGISVALLALFAWLSIKTGMIRAHEWDEKVGDRPYSLAMFQMMFWFYLVISAYVFIWLITGELDTITESVLALLGVGTGTALGGALLDSSAKKKEAKAAGDSSRSPPKSQGFLLDLLNEGDTISLSRFQLFLWTLTLGVIFCRSVYNSLHMPEFSATLLALMGISSGTYLGFKTQQSPNAGTSLALAAVVEPAKVAEDKAEPKG